MDGRFSTADSYKYCYYRVPTRAGIVWRSVYQAPWILRLPFYQISLMNRESLRIGLLQSYILTPFRDGQTVLLHLRRFAASEGKDKGGVEVIYP